MTDLSTDLPAQRGRIEAYAREHAAGLGLDAAGALAVAHLGDGESYRAWAVGPADAGPDGAPPLVFRVVRRPPGELPRPMAEEFAALELVPQGVGPRGVLLEKDPAALGAPFMIESFVAGRVVPREEWTPALFRAHARQLAALHSQTYETHGPVTAPDGTGALSMVATFAGAIGWWSASHPEITQRDDVGRLVAKVRRAVEAAEPAFARAGTFSLVHADLVVPNILIGDDGRPRYVDWEWAEIGDPARDLAYIGGRISASPWYVTMTGADVERFTAEYAEAAGISGSVRLADLRARRDAWELFERLFSSLHWRLMTVRSADPESTPYPVAAQEMTQGLQAWPEPA
jgi:aminoglycoside phosphotransferase (APT) family kinase protein